MKVTVDHPHLPKGEEIAILGNLAMVPNGESAEIDDETLALFEEQTGRTAEDAYKNSSTVAFGSESLDTKRKRLEKDQKENETREELPKETLLDKLQEGGEE